MSFERCNFTGEITFECDECGADYVLSSSDFGNTVAEIKHSGWVITGTNGHFTHICPDCAELDALSEFEELT